VRAAPDGTLWVGSGDGADYGGVDPLAYRSYDEQSYAGKIIHVTRDGLGLAGHPFCPADDDLTHVCTKLFAKGFRNPFRFHLRPGGLAVGDVGWNTREELDLLRFDQPGKSYGWPCYEGTIQTPAYKDGPECAVEYAKPAGSHLDPAYDYPHDGESKAVQSGPVYTATSYPEPYRNKLFVGDYATGILDQLVIDGSDQVTDVEPFVTGLGTVDVELGPSGNLVHVAIFAGRVEEIVYTPGARTPDAVATTEPSFGSLSLQVQFTGSGSSGPGR
jgi:glucose/arabinose dehydrogenase